MDEWEGRAYGAHHQIMLEAGVSNSAFSKLDRAVALALISHNSTVSRSTGFSPHEILFGEPPAPLLPGVQLPPVPADLAERPVDEYLRVLQRRLARIKQQVLLSQQQA